MYKYHNDYYVNSDYMEDVKTYQTILTVELMDRLKNKSGKHTAKEALQEAVICYLKPE